MPDLSTYNGMTKCTSDKWEDQKTCTLKNVEKSRLRDCCLWMSVDGYCTNPDAGQKNDNPDNEN